MDKRRVTVQELAVFKPLSAAHIAAGWAGRQNAIADIVKFHAKNDGFADGAFVLIQPPYADEGAAADAVRQCLQLGAAGILLTGAALQLSAELLSLADKYNIPILIHKPPVSEEEVMFVFQLSLQLKLQDKLLDLLESAGWDELQQSMLYGIPGVLARLKRYVCSPVALAGPSFEFLACGGEAPQPSPLLLQWLKSVYIKDYHRKFKNVKTGDPVTIVAGRINLEAAEEADYYAAALSLHGHIYGYLLLFETAGSITEIDLLRLKQSGLLCLKELVSRRNIEELEEKYRTQFIYDLLYNNFESTEALLQRGTFWGWDFTKPYQLMVLEAHKENQLVKQGDILPAVAAAVNAILRMNCIAGCASEQMGQIVVLFSVPAADEKSRKNNLAELAAKIRQYVNKKMPDLQLNVGAGRFYVNAAELCRSYQEAKQALELGRYADGEKPVAFFEDLGSLRLLANVSSELLEDFYKEYLEVLIDYDSKNGASLLITLQTYFQQNADLNLTAEKLFMHPNTLRYRLKKIEELIDADLQRFEVRLNLYIACKIAKMREASL